MKCPYKNCDYKANNLLVMDMHLNIIHKAYLEQVNSDTWNVIPIET